jgi:hypothetical protein
MRRILTVGLLGMGIWLGCGGSPKPPVLSDGPPPTSATPTALGDAAAPVATASPTQSDAPADAAAPVATAAATVAPPDPPPDDKCAPVAVAYEKSLRAKLKQCWLDAANKSKDRIIGSVKLVLEIDNTGKIASQRFGEKSDLPEPIQKCMMKVFKSEPIDGKKCDMKTFTIAEKFPR